MTSFLIQLAEINNKRVTISNFQLKRLSGHAHTQLTSTIWDQLVNMWSWAACSSRFLLYLQAHFSIWWNDSFRVILQCIRTIWTVRRSEFDGPDPMQYADVTCIISDPEGHFREKKYFELIWFSLPNISRVFSVQISGLFSVRFLSRSLGFIPRRR